MNSIDLTISFDTTGSIYPCLTQVRRNIVKMTKELFSNIDDLRIGVIAHGDYCDVGKPYTIKMLDLTSNVNKIISFVEGVEPTNGGDADECYELVLNQARTQINWGSGRKKMFVVIGDANPHGVGYPGNKNKLDWLNEAGLLNEAGVKIYAVHALAEIRHESKKFYQTIASLTDGVYLTLDQFSDATNLIMAACYQQFSEEALNDFVTIIRDKGQFNRNIRNNIQRLTGIEVLYTDTVQKDGLMPVPSGRFQVLSVPEDTSIKAFIESEGVEFLKGRGFYQLTKSEEVAQYKEIIVRDKGTGEMFNGSQVREMLTLLPQIEKGGAKERLNSRSLKEYDVFIQSTSSNRKLLADTNILYELPDWKD